MPAFPLLFDMPAREVSADIPAVPLSDAPARALSLLGPVWTPGLAFSAVSLPGPLYR
jgi:hypothetical protein